MSKRETNWLKGLAAVMVVLSHYAEWWSWFVPTQGAAETVRYAVSKLGVYGVDIFFLCSGYAMVKSLGQERMHPGFVGRRVRNVYLPYLIVVGIIEVLSGGFTSVKDFLTYAVGYDYWYMAVLFMFYIGFIAVYTIMGGREPRVIAFCILTYIVSKSLYDKGMHDFWYVSNIAFAMGVIAAEYEEAFKRAVQKTWLPMVLMLGAGMIQVVRSGLTRGSIPGNVPDEHLLFMEIAATVMWTLLVLVSAAKCSLKGKLLAFIGNLSLYIYLIHTYVFMSCVNNIKLDYLWIFMISGAITVAVSYLLHRSIDMLGKKIVRTNQIMFEE